MVLLVASISIADSTLNLVQKSAIVYSYESLGFSGYCVADKEQFLSGIGPESTKEDVINILGKPIKRSEDIYTFTDNYYYDGATIVIGQGSGEVIMMMA